MSVLLYLRPRTCWALGVVSGVLLLVGCRQFIVWSSLPDRFVAPLILADSNGRAGVVVVLGAGVVGDCATNLNSFRRVMLGVKLWKAGRAPRILFTGGSGDSSCAVAEAMARMAREIGVPADVIATETGARSTHENAVFSTELLGPLAVDGILLVTDQLHMRRAVRSFTHVGVRVERASVPVNEGHINNLDMLFAGVREIAALAYYSTRGWLGALEIPSAPRTVETEMLDRSVLQDAANPTGAIVLLGASYAAGWPIAAVGDATVVNKGVAGQVTADMLERFDRDVVQARPRAIILWGFINDFFRASALDDRTREMVVRNLNDLIEQAERNGIVPVLATEITVRENDSWTALMLGLVGRALGRKSYQSRINLEVGRINQWIQETAARKGLLVLDLRRALVDERGVRRREYTKDDGGHITPLGYAALTAYATPALERFFVTR